MKRLLVLTLIISNLNLYAKEELSCMEKYKKSLSKKEASYKKAYDRYKKNRGAAQSAVLSDGFRGQMSGGGLIGSMYLQNSSAPSKSDYDMFEKDIIKAAEADLSKFISIKPTVLEGIYNAAYEKYSDVTHQKIQNLINLGFDQGKFCGLLGKRRVPGIQRWVLKQLKKESKDSVVVREPAVMNFKEDGKEYPDMKEELNKPLEIYVKPE